MVAPSSLCANCLLVYKLILNAYVLPLPEYSSAGSDDFGGSPGGGSLFPSELQLQRAPAAAAGPAALPFADEPMTLTLPPVALGLKSQSQLDAERAKAAVLPPLQSVLELTTAFRPPERCVRRASMLISAWTLNFVWALNGICNSRASWS